MFGEEYKKFKIKDLPDNHIAQADFDLWMNEKVCPKCGMANKIFFSYGQECSSCHSREPFIERWKYYDSKK